MSSKALAYRPDIDGLRAIAVILVLLFHFDLGVPGGFVGVDVFFVISGYLITEVIRNGMRAGRFTFHDFYVRRLLRLHPALLVTLAATLGAGFLLMDPASFSDLAASAQYATFSASNFYFWLNQNYFDASAHTKPLLHTWSLAAEWQFYLVWPFIVWATMKVSQKALPIVLVALVAASLISSQWMLSHDSSAAYFMMPFRVFELAIGALLVFAPNKRTVDSTDPLILLAGLGAIFGSAFLLTDKTPFPGLAAVIPCLGAAACIYAGQSAMGSVLRLWPVVKAGVYSYSIYLVHWPIIILYKYYVYREISLSEKLALLSVSVIVGAFQYWAVEKRFIQKNNTAKAIGFVGALTTSAAVAYFCVTIITSNGMPQRIPANNLKMAENPAQYHIKNYGGAGYDLEPILGNKDGKKIAIMLGDSFAWQYSSGLDRSLKEAGLSIKGYFKNGCFMSPEYTRIENGSPRQSCRDMYAKAIEALEGNDLPLILAMSWSGYGNNIADSAGRNVQKEFKTPYNEILTDSLARIRKELGNRNIIIVGSQPFLPTNMNVVSCLIRPDYIDQGCQKSLEYPLEKSFSFSANSALKDFAEKNKNTTYYDSTGVMCQSGKCRSVIDGKIMYSDASHLSIDGSTVVSKDLLKFIIDHSNTLQASTH
ncbi:acyltransferase family protein [Pseudomonas qingdaonensis]|uniref:acyltransferase family protein n=1 Tax=Pseudomonas qingdaonensis TaxID=2056231 RepID=UPI003342730D